MGRIANRNLHYHTEGMNHAERKVKYLCVNCGASTFAFDKTKRAAKQLCNQCFGKKEDLRPKELNDLTGADWARFSLSVQEYPDTRSEKQRLHGACFPTSLAKQYIQKYTKSGDSVFDPFVGVGTTFDACVDLKRNCYGIEINKEFYQIAKNDIPKKSQKKYRIFNADAEHLDRYIASESVDFILTSPPYLALLKNVKNAFAYKWKEHSRLTSIMNPRPYSILAEDLGNMAFDDYFQKLNRIMSNLYKVLREDKYMTWVVKDFRDLKNGKAYVNFHGDIINCAIENNFLLWDIVIYNQTKFRPLVCLGYPSANYYHNIGHSYILIFRKGTF